MFLYTHSMGHYADFHEEAAKAACAKIAEGFSLRAAAGFIDLPYNNLLQWIMTTPAFALAVDVAAAKRVFHMESVAMATKDPVQAKVALTALQKAAPEAWNDKTAPEEKQLPTKIEQQIVYPERREQPKIVEALPIIEAPLPKERLN